MIRASIDIGSNSCLLLVLEIENNSFKTLESHSQITSLGKDLDINKSFLESSIIATMAALRDYRNILLEHSIDPSDVIVTATEASRVATNFDNLFNQAKEELGLIITRISGEGEAYYTALGVARGSSGRDSTITIMDIGGASTELIKVELDEFKILESISLPVGSVRATDWLAKNEFSTNIGNVLSAQSLKSFEVSKLICVAGTMTTLAAIAENMKDFDESGIQGKTYSITELEKMVSKLESRSSSDILSAYPVTGKRSSSIYGGALVAREVANFLKVSEFEISTYGLRYGVAIEGRVDERFI